MEWWIWVLLGLALLLLELFVPTGFFIFLIGIGAVITGLLVALGLGGPAWFHWFLLVVVSTCLLLFVRKYMVGKSISGGREPDSGPRGQEVSITSDIPAGGTGQGQLRGAVWTVRNAGSLALRPGDRCLVDSVEGIALVVRSKLS